MDHREKRVADIKRRIKGNLVEIIHYDIYWSMQKLSAIDARNREIERVPVTAANDSYAVYLIFLGETAVVTAAQEGDLMAALNQPPEYLLEVDLGPADIRVFDIPPVYYKYLVSHCLSSFPRLCGVKTL
jgi:hypothetical protein